MRREGWLSWFSNAGKRKQKRDDDDDKKRRGPGERSALATCLYLVLCVLAVLGVVAYFARGKNLGGSFRGAMPRLRRFSPKPKPKPVEKWHPNLDRIQSDTWKDSPHYHKPVKELEPSVMGRRPLPSHPDFRGGFKLRINVFTFNRVDSLKRLIVSDCGV